MTGSEPRLNGAVTAARAVPAAGQVVVVAGTPVVPPVLGVPLAFFAGVAVGVMPLFTAGVVPGLLLTIPVGVDV